MPEAYYEAKNVCTNILYKPSGLHTNKIAERRKSMYQIVKKLNIVKGATIVFLRKTNSIHNYIYIKFFKLFRTC